MADRTYELQAMIYAAGGAPVALPAGVYPISSPLRLERIHAGDHPGLRLIGAGSMLTRIESHYDGPAIVIGDGEGGFHRGAEVSHLSIIGDPSLALGTGVDRRAAWHASIDDVRIVGMGRDGIRFSNQAADADSCGFARLHRLDIRQCGRHGIACDVGPLGTALGGVEVAWSYIVSNGGDGIMSQFAGPRIANSTIAYNGGAGLRLPGSASGGEPVIECVEFDSNREAHVVIDECYAALVRGCGLKATTIGGALWPPVSVRLGCNPDRLASNPVIAECMASLDNKLGKPHTTIEIGSMARRAKVERMFWHVFQDPAIKLTDAGQGTEWDEAAR